jgi:hypothetical protein
MRSPATDASWRVTEAAARLRENPSSARVLESWAIMDGYRCGAPDRHIDEDEYDARSAQLSAQERASRILRERELTEANR